MCAQHALSYHLIIVLLSVFSSRKNILQIECIFYSEQFGECFFSFFVTQDQIKGLESRFFLLVAPAPKLLISRIHPILRICREHGTEPKKIWLHNTDKMNLFFPTTIHKKNKRIWYYGKNPYFSLR